MNTDEDTTTKQGEHTPKSQKSPKEPFNIWSYEPNKREQAILDDCSRVFFARFIPTSLAAGLGVMIGIQHGFLRSNTKFGPVPKLVATTILSYAACQIAVAGECREAIKTLHKSPLADHFREEDRERPK